MAQAEVKVEDRRRCDVDYLSVSFSSQSSNAAFSEFGHINGGGEGPLLEDACRRTMDILTNEDLSAGSRKVQYTLGLLDFFQHFSPKKHFVTENFDISLYKITQNVEIENVLN